MFTATFPSTIDPHESLRGSLAASLAFHASLCILVIVYAKISLGGHLQWGNPEGGKGSVRVNAIASLPGIPLPSPKLATPNTLATENPGLYQEEPRPAPEPPPEAQEIPKFKEAVKPSKAELINKRILKEALVTPPNAIPLGEGGKPALNYGQITNGDGDGALGFEDGLFGDRYGWYVQAIRSRISNNWLMSTISPTITSARRVYVSFDIQRDGAVTNVQLTQSSGVAEIDRSALRAVYASNPLGPLPQDYSRSKLSVRFYFDFRR